MRNKTIDLENKAKEKKEEFLGWVIAAIILLIILANFGCSQKHIYVTPNGKQVETSEFALRAMAIRDRDIETEKNFNTAMKGASDLQAFGLTVNKVTQKGQPIERDPTWSEEGRAWAGLFLRYFGGGIDVLNSRKSEVRSQVYNINGNNNNMSGINNRAESNQGEVTQSLSSSSAPYEANQAWTQDGTSNSANGAGSTEETTTEGENQ